MSILLLTKTSTWSRSAQAFLKSHGLDTTVCEGERGDPRPAPLDSWQGDYLISFLCPWVVPASALSRTKVAAINFHPGPPEYPGIGCYNFALYDGALTYGVTCHHMAPRVDSGAIIAVRRFPVLPADTVEHLKDRSMAQMLVLFYEVVERVVRGGSLPASDETWRRLPYTRRELGELCRITADMPGDEVARRVRATVFPGAPGPFIDVAGFRFELS